MQANQIVKEISRLPLADKLFVAEQIFKQLREANSKEAEESENRRKVAKLLAQDYKADSDLIAFTAIDGDAFYEAK